MCQRVDRLEREKKEREKTIVNQFHSEKIKNREQKYKRHKRDFVFSAEHTHSRNSTFITTTNFGVSQLIDGRSGMRAGLDKERSDDQQLILYRLQCG